jgi:hypothetical protein
VTEEAADAAPADLASFLTETPSGVYALTCPMTSWTRWSRTRGGAGA